MSYKKAYGANDSELAPNSPERQVSFEDETAAASFPATFSCGSCEAIQRLAKRQNTVKINGVGRGGLMIMIAANKRAMTRIGTQTNILFVRAKVHMFAKRLMGVLIYRASDRAE
jgi:hypothetical protein